MSPGNRGIDKIVLQFRERGRRVLVSPVVEREAIPGPFVRPLQAAELGRGVYRCGGNQASLAEAYARPTTRWRKYKRAFWRGARSYGGLFPWMVALVAMIDLAWLHNPTLEIVLLISSTVTFALVPAIGWFGLWGLQRRRTRRMGESHRDQERYPAPSWNANKPSYGSKEMPFELPLPEPNDTYSKRIQLTDDPREYRPASEVISLMDRAETVRQKVRRHEDNLQAYVEHLSFLRRS